MSLIDRLRSLFSRSKSTGSSAGAGASSKDARKSRVRAGKVDVATRFVFSKEAWTGTMSKFQRVHDNETGDTVGLKILDPEKYELFEKRWKELKKPWEGEIALKLRHPRIVETYEIGTTVKGERYLLMEYIDGHNLAALISSQDPLLDGNRVNLMRQMAEAVHAVHQAGFIHRDVCPRNFICSQDATSLKLIDFGLTLPDLPPYRMAGNRTGTPLYMAPEIVRRRPTDKRVDLFALGVSFYRLLTNAYPWGGNDSTGAGALAHDVEPPTPVETHVPDVRPELSSLIMKCIDPNPDKRPQTSEAIVNALKTMTGDGRKDA